MNSQFTTIDLLLSPVLHKFPRLRVALSEGGIGWIPYVLERADYTWERHRWYTGVNTEVRPSELFKDHIFGCFIAAKAGVEIRALAGIDHLMCVGDHPHRDNHFPNSRTNLARDLPALPDNEARQADEGHPHLGLNFH